ncbi:STAS domain-containing protein [Amycolatopsis thermophila]|uniref:Anti-sigma factor antagonist n=1 Tax=Amycolatopsis thermophila TaxID=206084 RepID=A0ABU0F5P6_9PSEU|nr:STAS domain-containing protein [Amycolatopsis thermophila]MDQ0382908.1 anti-sigma B factor antagonist [Amycolatopsis thermophila]
MPGDIAFHNRTPRPDTMVVTVSGEIDMVTGSQLRDHLDAACQGLPAGGQVVADLRSVSFLGCSGLNVLAAANERIQRSGKHLRVVADRPAVLRPLQLTMLDQKLPVDVTLRAALASR